MGLLTTATPCGGHWPPVARLSVGCGESTVHGQVCEHCARLQYSFTRHVAVGSCTVTDRLCVRCDEALKLDEADVPGLGLEVSPLVKRYALLAEYESHLHMDTSAYLPP